MRPMTDYTKYAALPFSIQGKKDVLHQGAMASLEAIDVVCKRLERLSTYLCCCDLAL